MDLGKAKMIIENFYKDNDSSNHMAILSGAGYYLTKNQDNIYSLFNYKNDLIYGNIKTPIFKNKVGSTYLDLTLSDDSFVCLNLNCRVPETTNSGEISTGEGLVADNYGYI